MIPLASLAVLGGFFLNLPLQWGVGIREIFLERKGRFGETLLEAALLFVSALIQWLLFVYVFSPLALGALVYFMPLPLAAALALCSNAALKKLSPGAFAGHEAAFVFSYRSGASLAAVFMLLSLAGSFREALILAMGISLGVFFASIILRAIHFRIEREKVSGFVRGMPLLLITMGLLSLAFSSVAIICLR
jgi:electron transport complex protein RnfA